MNKYLSSGTPSFTFATRTVAGATMSTPLDSTDVGRVSVFRIGTSLYWSRISSVPSATSLTLHNETVTLPVADGTIDLMLVLDQTEQHEYNDFIVRIQSLIQDAPGKLSLDSIKLSLAAAVTDFGRDKPQTAAFKIQGNGTALYSMATMLGAYWKPGKTRVVQIEYPLDSVPRSYVATGNWTMYNDGSAQDGSNIQLLLSSATPTTTEYFIVHVTYELDLPEVGSQNFPDTDENFTNISLLAGAYCCQALAAAYAPTSDSTISADVVNYGEKSSRYLRLSRTYLEAYAENIFGNKDQVAAATYQTEIETRASDRGLYLFHSNR